MRRDGLREATRKAKDKAETLPKARRRKNLKAHRKRMSTVAAVYTLAPFARTPEDVVSGLKLKPGEIGPARPKPQDKRVWASLEASPEEVAMEAFEEARMRHAHTPRRWVGLVDGNEVQLSNLLFLAEHHQIELTVIIDIIHVLEYLWSAGRAFESEGSAALEKWVTERFLKILQGKAPTIR